MHTEVHQNTTTHDDVVVELDPMVCVVFLRFMEALSWSACHPSASTLDTIHTERTGVQGNQRASDLKVKATSACT